MMVDQSIAAEKEKLPLSIAHGASLERPDWVGLEPHRYI